MKRRHPIAWDCATDDMRETTYNGMAEDLAYTWAKIERLKAENEKMKRSIDPCSGSCNYPETSPMTPTDRLRAALHMESAAIAPQTSPIIEAAKEVLAEVERLRAALKLIVDTNYDKFDNGPCDELAMIAEDALNQQNALHSEDGK